MIRIVGVQRGGCPEREFVFLQNQGLRRLSLKGLAVIDDVYFYGDYKTMADRMFVFREDVLLLPGSFAALFTGCGDNGWGKTIDGSTVYFCYWGRSACVWDINPDANMHLLQIASSFSTPKEVIFRGIAACV